MTQLSSLRYRVFIYGITVNNAGYVLGVERVGEIADADIESMFATNVLGLISMTQLLIKGDAIPFRIQPLLRLNPIPCTPDFKAKKAGHVINIGSIAGREPYAGGSIYTATKHAVNAFTGSLMRELVDTPIRVTEIQPGWNISLSTLERIVLILSQAWWRQNSQSYASAGTSPELIKFTRVSNHVSVSFRIHDDHCFKAYLL